ncbi:PREDICTED: circadian locomoter output cycles protein kaput-like [Amphimedon queenslandica]|uniref:PAS domain-containing protein n=1 Tax=Amphimedon queenslandica TaxID=400682 RepID=A0A1X7UUY1_AMPQE|nr:PREDICTED: circadian locomoter output cycles protein kaput-like [Amphimedon queenslandica]|eukprot:XP_003386656.1 PREDICTED: circadian locomoter output cycles protein kaput-like [Amphimedon queenslandica]
MASSPVSVGEDDEPLIGGARKRGKVRKESEHKRRLMMNQYFDELVILLSMVTETVSSRKMDKVTTLHEAVSLFKLYYDLDQSQGPTSKANEQLHQTYRPEYLQFGDAASFILDSLGAFLMVLSETGRILYSTDLITSLTGYLPCRVVGQTIYDCLHTDDHFIIKDLYRVSGEEGVAWNRKDSPIICYPPKSLRCRFKIFSNDNSMSGSSRSFSCLSYLRQWKEVPADNTRSPMGDSCSSRDDTGLMTPDTPVCCLLLIAKLDENLSIVDEPFISNGSIEFSFDIRVSREGKILDMSKQASLILGYTSNELVGSLFFDYVDPFHLEKVSESILEFLKKGLGVSQPYRLISKSLRSVWVVSKGFLSYNPWNHKPDHILLQCKVLGCDEILPESRFSHDSRYLPDLKGNEFYRPGPVTPAQPVPEPRPVRRQQQQQPPVALPPKPPPSLPPLPPVSLAPVQPLTSPANQQRHEERRGGGERERSLLDEVKRELERKNQELFEMQQKVLAQQQLIEQERHQFYQVTNQVMNFIGSQQQNIGTNTDPLSGMDIHPSMAMMIRNSSVQTPPPPLGQGKTPNFQLSLQQQQQQSFNSSLSMPTPTTPNSAASEGGMMSSGQLTNQMMGGIPPPGHMSTSTSHMTQMTNQMSPMMPPPLPPSTHMASGGYPNKDMSYNNHMTSGQPPAQMDIPFPGMLNQTSSASSLYASRETSAAYPPNQESIPPNDNYLPSYLPSSLCEMTDPISAPPPSFSFASTTPPSSSLSNPADQQQRLLLDHLQQLYRSYNGTS